MRFIKPYIEPLEESEIQFNGFDLDKARAYLAININDIKEDQKTILKHLIPERAKKTGTRPTMSSIGMKWNPKNIIA